MVITSFREGDEKYSSFASLELCAFKSELIRINNSKEMFTKA